ncbi:S1 family peptidase, partial [Actinoplanes cyaneus]|uniref:S1 family peptidase n=1 Tax=Actinoplanes cyaneus TaxID=52696 RepID=UPI0031CE45E3
MERQDQRTGRHRVVEVFGAAYGSGYAIGDQLVLTARHLLSPAGDRPQRVQVRVAGEPDFRGATVVWARRGAGDAALLAVDDAPWAGTPDSGAVRWGRILEFDAAVPVRARGFPAVQAARRGEQEVRELATVRGAVETMSPDTKRYEITVESGVPLLPGDGGSPWSGLSGAAVMDARKRIVGVVVAHRMRYGGAVLQATPVERLFTDPEFLRHAGTDESRLEDVTAQRSVPLDARGDGSILKTVAAPPSLIGLEDYELLQAGNEAVGFLGRDDQRRDLLAWCAADEHVSLGLVAGAGGAGKTRLGIQLCRDLTERGWSAGFADENILDEVLRSHVVDVVWPTLLVLDYPDRLSRRVITWITGLGARRYGPKLRFLLLDRVPGDEAARADLTWWAGVKRIPFISRPSITVRLRSGGLSHEERLRHRDAARRAFSGGTADLSRLDLRDDAYGNPLKVHVAVLLAVHGDRYPTAGDLMASFLDREMEHWQERLAAHRIHDIGFTQARQVLALATLTRPEIDVVPELLPAIRQLSDADGVRRGNLGNWLAELFGTGSRIAALEPDLLAEELLASTPELPDLVVAIHGLAACTTEHTATMLDALNLAAGNRDEVRTALGNLLVSCLGPLVTRAAAEPAGRLPGLIGAALDRVGADAGAGLAAGAAVIRRVPRREESYRLMTTRLARLAIAWCDAQPPHAPTGPVRADALTDLA